MKKNASEAKHVSSYAELKRQCTRSKRHFTLHDINTVATTNMC